MKTISLEYAQTLSGDPEAIKRGYITTETLMDAQRLAKEAVLMPTFGKLGYLAAIGNPHQWWAQNSKAYTELEKAPRYARAKNFSLLLKLANEICFEEKVETVISTRDALRLTNQQKSEEFIILTEWLSHNQYTF